MPSRIGSLQVPAGAKGFPIVLLLIGFSLATGALLVGLLRLHWGVLVLLPVVVYTVWIMFRVARAMKGGQGRKEKKVEEEEGT